MFKVIYCGQCPNLTAKLRLSLRFATPRYAPFGQIVRAHFQLNVVAFDYTDIVEAKFAGNIGGYYIAVGKLNLKCCIGQAFDYLAFSLDYVVLGQNLIPPI